LCHPQAQYPKIISFYLRETRQDEIVFDYGCSYYFSLFINRLFVQNTKRGKVLFIMLQHILIIHKCASYFQWCHLVRNETVVTM
jgi:hypothetical protein